MFGAWFGIRQMRGDFAPTVVIPIHLLDLHSCDVENAVQKTETSLHLRWEAISAERDFLSEIL